MSDMLGVYLFTLIFVSLVGAFAGIVFGLAENTIWAFWWMFLGLPLVWSLFFGMIALALWISTSLGVIRP